MMEGYNHLVDAEDLNGRNIYKVAEKRGQKRAAELLQEASEQEVGMITLITKVAFKHAPSDVVDIIK